MTGSIAASEIIPIDSKGRVRMSAKRREELLDEFEKSKLSGAEFARLIGVKYPTFAFWRQQRRRRRSPAAAGGKSGPVEWLETVIDKAQAADAVSGAGVVVRFPSGAMIELANASQAATAAAFLRAWEQAVC